MTTPLFLFAERIGRSLSIDCASTGQAPHAHDDDGPIQRRRSTLVGFSARLRGQIEAADGPQIFAKFYN
jgi:hypothetical protein